MASKDSEARAAIEAVCKWLIEDGRFMPNAVNRLRDYFETAIAPRGMFQRGKQETKEVPPRVGRS
ncbi:MAG TPA: hypothetical protein VIT90_17055 [Lysobacter sp.]